MNEKIKLIYFEGCPEAKNARAALLTSGISDFEVVEQGQLRDDHPLKRYSSPSILKNDEILFGSKLSYGTSACSFQKLDAEKIKAKLNADQTQDKKGKKGGVLGAVASLGSGLAVGLCPMCIPAIGAFLSSIGLGIVVQDSVLRPALITMLLIANGGFLWGYLKKHHILWPFLVGMAASIGMYLGRYVYISSWANMLLMYGTIPLLIAAALWNLRLVNKAKKIKGCAAC